MILRKLVQIIIAIITVVSMHSVASPPLRTTDSLYTSLNKSSHSTPEKLDILYKIINYHNLSNQYADMRSAIDKAYKLLQGSGDSCLYNKFLLAEAKYISATEDKKDAISLANKILFSAQFNRCVELEITTLLLQAKFLLRHSNPDTCLKKIIEARNLAVEIKDELLISRTYNMEGVLNFFNKKYIESRRLMILALETFRKFDEVEMLGKAYSDIAYTYYLQSVYDSALMYNKIADLHLQNTESYVDVVRNYNSMALVYQNIGKLDEAIEAYFNGLRIADLINSSKDRILILYNIGNCYYKLDAKDKAIDNFRFCLEHAVLDKDTFSIIYASNAIGSLALESNQIDTAIKYIPKSFGLAKIINNTYMLMFNSWSMSTLEMERENYKLAQEYLDNAYNYAKELNNPADFISINMVQAELYSKLKLYNKAIDLLNETYLNALHINSKENARNILIDLAEIYEESGDLGNALVFTKKAKKYQDSINSMSILANLVEAENKYENEKTEKIKQLELEKAELKRVSELRNTKLFNLLLIISVVALVITTWLFYMLSKTRKKKNQNLKDKNKLIRKHSGELKKLIEELQKTSSDLKLSNKTKTKLLSIIGHDLRSPFNVIQGYISILADSDLDPGLRKTYYERINKASNQLLDLIDSLVIWSQTQTNKIQFNPSKTNITKLSNRAISFLQNSADLKDIQLVYNSPPTRDIFVKVDSDMLTRIIHNLLVNSIKFTPKGGTIFIDHELKDSYLRYSIKDNGVGMQPEIASSLFEKSSELVKKGTEGEKGTGLGLSICKEFIKYHHGTIWAESELNVGTSIFFKIPNK